MKIFIFVFLSLFLNAQKSNLPPSVSVTDDYFGTKIIDEYRNLENLKDSATIKWMKSQADYANSVINKVPNKDYFLNKRLEFDKRQGYSVSNLSITRNDKYFYLKKNSGEETAKVYYRNGFSGKEELLYDPFNFNSSFKDSSDKSNHHFIINLLSPSWDGSRLAISLTENGKEISEVITIDVNNKYIHPEIITNTDPSNIGGIKWLEDNSGFFYVYYPVIDSNSKEYGKNIQTLLYKIGQDPKNLNVIFSKIHNPNLKIEEMVYPGVLVFNPDDKYYIGMLADSEDFRRTFIIKKEDLLKGEKNWKPLYNKEDKVRYIRLEGDEIYFLSGYHSLNYKLCKTNVNNPNFRNPQILVPEKKDEVINDFYVTKDGVYYTRTKNGVEAKLYFLKNGKEINIKTPSVFGNIDLESKGKDYSDLWIYGSGWTSEEQRYRYDLSNNSFILEDLASTVSYPEFKDIIVEEITVKSYDGVEVPLSLIYNKNIKKDGNIPVLINGYGAYAESYYPYFSLSYLLWISQGGMVAVPHVRGGGEKGEQWHIDGQKLKKPNSWKDLIACSEYLIKEKYTSPQKIALLGGSAGGILMGRAMTERPDLFRAVIVESGVLNTLRKEYAGGTGNTSIQEYGSVKNPKEFKGLLEMDSYYHIKKGVKYPATLITSGINDPRVSPWMPAKFVAKLLANDASDNPILLKIDYEGGHGGDIPAEQRYANLADIFAFAFWQLGQPRYQLK